MHEDLPREIYFAVFRALSTFVDIFSNPTLERIPLVGNYTYFVIIN